MQIAPAALLASERYARDEMNELGTRQNTGLLHRQLPILEDDRDRWTTGSCLVVCGSVICWKTEAERNQNRIHVTEKHFLKLFETILQFGRGFETEIAAQLASEER
jgi:hypothetical protein